MGYISELRKIVGHRPVIHLCASVIVEDEKGRILMQKRVDSGDWCYCGGSVELYERTEDTAARELLEETGLVADELTLFGVFSGEDLRYVYPNGDEVSTVDILYICRSYHGNAAPQPEEVTELRFMYVDEVSALDICPPARVPLKKYIQTRRGAIF